MALHNCPLCKREGNYVSSVTVSNKVKNYFKRHLKSAEYCCCIDTYCDVVFFNNENDEIFFKRDMEEPME